jgi:NADPH-dependent 2,4-dienoyl-CoA reductase/sulfur reductase-like enzyme
MTKLLIIGGSDAGISAALGAREIDSSAQVKVLTTDAFPNYSICGIPFFLSGEVSDWHSLAHRTENDLRELGIEILLNHRALSIAQASRTVSVEHGGRLELLPFDRLIIATGAVSVRPIISGMETSGVYSLRWMNDCFDIDQYLETQDVRSAVIIGSGYIAVEMADAFTRNGVPTTVLARSGSVLRRTVDPVLGDIVAAEMERNRVKVMKNVSATAIERKDGRLAVKGKGVEISCDVILLATGVAPRSNIARAAGVTTGIKGAIQVNSAMETNLPHVFAAGDCVETFHRLLNEPGYLPLGTTAHKQGRVAGINAVGGRAEFAGSLGTQVVKVFDMVVGGTGLREAEALKAGFEPVTVETETWDHKAYYPGAGKLRIRITGDKRSRRLLGVQMAGPYGSEVAKRIDVFAASLFNEMTVDALLDLDLSYSPPLSSPWDPVQEVALNWLKNCR